MPDVDLSSAQLWKVFPPICQLFLCKNDFATALAFIPTPATTLLARLLPDATVLRLEACEMDDTTAQITLRVQSTQTKAPCPLCATPARRIHS